MPAILRGRRAIVAGAILTLAVAGAAFAYWTSTGTGTGTGAAGTSSPVNAVQTTTLTAMYPGDTAQTISGKFNNTGTGPQYVTKVVASISSVTLAAGAAAGTCDATDFTLANATMNVGAEVPAGSNQGAWTGATIKFNDKGTNQDACKLATVNLSYAVS